MNTQHSRLGFGFRRVHVTRSPLGTRITVSSWVCVSAYNWGPAFPSTLRLHGTDVTGSYCRTTDVPCVRSWSGSHRPSSTFAVVGRCGFCRGASSPTVRAQAMGQRGSDLQKTC